MMGVCDQLGVDVAEASVLVLFGFEDGRFADVQEGGDLVVGVAVGQETPDGAGLDRLRTRDVHQCSPIGCP